MRTTVRVRVDARLAKLLTRLSREAGRSRSDFASECLRRQVSLLRFRRLRRKVLALAEAQGRLTDEDIARVVS